jgi:DNA replication protein DnaC
VNGIARLATGAYLVNHQDIILQGPTGAGKTYLACALGNRACEQNWTVTYLRAAELFDQISIAEHLGQRPQTLEQLAKTDLLHR